MDCKEWKGERKKCKKSHPNGGTIVTSDLRARHLMRSHEQKGNNVKIKTEKSLPP